MKEAFDMGGPSEGLESPEGAAELAVYSWGRSQPLQFLPHGCFAPLETSRRGIFVAGAFQGPKRRSGKRCRRQRRRGPCRGLLSGGRNTRVHRKSYPEEVETDGNRGSGFSSALAAATSAGSGC